MGGYGIMVDINNDEWVTSSGKLIHIKSLIEDTLEEEVYDIQYENFECNLLISKTGHFIFDCTKQNWMKIISCDLQDYFLKTIEFARCKKGDNPFPLSFMLASWGVLLEKKPEKFYPISEMWNEDISKRIVFTDAIFMFRSCLNISKAIRLAHYKGFVLMGDIYNNVYINPNSGDVKISPRILVLNDHNIISSESATEWCPLFSIHNGGEYKPSIDVDEYILALIIYRILLINHPMEGKKCLECIGSLPSTYTFDPNDDSNRPIYFWGNDALVRQRLIPNAMKSLFERTFVNGAVTPGKLVPEIEWIEKLESIINDISSNDEKHIKLNSVISIYSDKRTLDVKAGRYEQKFADQESFLGVIPGDYKCATFFYNEEIVDKWIVIYQDYVIALTEEENNQLVSLFTKRYITRDSSYLFEQFDTFDVYGDSDDFIVANILPFEILLDNDEVIRLSTDKVDDIELFFVGLLDKNGISTNITYAMEIYSDIFYLRINYIERINKYLISYRKELFNGLQGYHEYSVDIRDLVDVNQTRVVDATNIDEIIESLAKSGLGGGKKHNIKIYSFNAKKRTLECENSLCPVDLGLLKSIMVKFNDNDYCRNTLNEFNIREKELRAEKEDNWASDTFGSLNCEGGASDGFI